MIQGSEEWFAARKGRVTGSVAGAILGMSPHMTREDVMRMMVREYHDAPKEIDKFVEEVIFAYGKHHEPGAILEYEMETGNTVEPCGFFEYEDWLGASPDGIIDENTLLEIKCPYGKRNTPKPVIFKTAQEQPHYYAQMQIEMLCSKRQWAHFYQWAPNGDIAKKVIFDPGWIYENLGVLYDFYTEYLVERELPKAQKYLDPELNEIDTTHAAKLLAEYDELKVSEDLAKERKADIIKELAVIADNKSTIICGRHFTLVEKKGSISYAKALKKLAPGADLKPYTGKATKYWKLT